MFATSTAMRARFARIATTSAAGLIPSQFALDRNQLQAELKRGGAHTRNVWASTITGVCVAPRARRAETSPAWAPLQDG